MSDPKTGITLRSAGLQVVVEPGRGMTIVRLIDLASGLDALWLRTGHVPPDPIRDLGPSGAGSIETFGDRFIGGWFLMAPAVGFPGTVPGPAGPTESLLHGEACRLPWEVAAQGDRSIVATLDLVRTPLRVTRRLELDDTDLTIETSVENRSEETVQFAWGEHPCFRRESFAGGRLELVARSSSVPGDGVDPANGTLLPGTHFAFPYAPGRAGHSVDVAAIPLHADGRHDQAIVELGSPTFRLTAPRAGRALRVDVDPATYSHALLWLDYRAPGASFWGSADVIAVEPIAFSGRSMADAVGQGALTPLPPGSHATTVVRARWEAIQRGRAMPERSGARPGPPRPGR